MKTNHSLNMDDLKLFAKTEDDFALLVNTVRIIGDDDISMKFGVSKCSHGFKEKELVSRRNMSMLI